MAEQKRGLVALTGATGFIGQHLIGALLRGGWRVKALTRRPDTLPEIENLQTVTGVLEDRPALHDLVAGADAVIHAAGRIAGRNRRDFESANVLGTENLVQAVASLPHPPTIMHLSTMAAREPHLSYYAATKREGEDRLRQLGQALRWQVLRPPVVYGPGDKQTLKLFRLFKKGLALKPGSESRFSMIYVDDLVSAILYLLRDSTLNSAVFELDDGHENGYSWDDIAAEASRKLGRDIRTFGVPGPILHLMGASASLISSLTNQPLILSRGKINEFTHADWVATTNLLSEINGWKANVNLRDGISETIDWYVSQGWL